MGTYVGNGPAIAMRTTEAGNLDTSPTKGLDDGDRRTARGLTHKPTTTLLHANTGVLGAPSVGLPAPAPMPKWPANWQSAAFEAVAVKKSYILSPPEIYAECAHHGGARNWGRGGGGALQARWRQQQRGLPSHTTSNITCTAPHQHPHP